MESAASSLPAPVLTWADKPTGYDEGFMEVMRAYGDHLRTREAEHAEAVEEARRKREQLTEEKRKGWEEDHADLPYIEGPAFKSAFAMLAPWYQSLVAKLPLRMPVFFDGFWGGWNCSMLKVMLGGRTWQFCELFDGSISDCETVQPDPDAHPWDESHAVTPPPELSPWWMRERLQFAFSNWLSANAPEVDQDALWRALDAEFPVPEAYLAFMVERMASLGDYLSR